jgi:hypothetical protein
MRFPGNAQGKYVYVQVSQPGAYPKLIRISRAKQDEYEPLKVKLFASGQWIETSWSAVIMQ